MIGWSGEGSEVKGEVDTLPSIEADQLGLLTGVWHASSDGVGPWRHLDVEILTYRHTALETRGLH